MNFLVNAVGQFAKGGPVMIPLLICSLISVTVIFERFSKIKRARIDIKSTMLRAEDALYAHNTNEAVSILESHGSAVGRVLAAGIGNTHLGDRAVERAMEEQGTQELSALTHRLGWLDTIITIAPLLGLLGTVTGMISAFHVMAGVEGLGTPTAITGGVAEALYATATGLGIAIFTLVCYNHLQESIKAIVAEIEHRSNAVLNILTDAGERPSEITSLSA
jgi:biopolymer transport protein ExbB